MPSRNAWLSPVFLSRFYSKAIEPLKFKSNKSKSRKNLRNSSTGLSQHHLQPLLTLVLAHQPTRYRKVIKQTNKSSNRHYPSAISPAGCWLLLCNSIALRCMHWPTALAPWSIKVWIKRNTSFEVHSRSNHHWPMTGVLAKFLYHSLLPGSKHVRLIMKWSIKFVHNHIAYRCMIMINNNDDDIYSMCTGRNIFFIARLATSAGSQDRYRPKKYK